jgi:hypothetical protein
LSISSAVKPGVVETTWGDQKRVRVEKSQVAEHDADAERQDDDRRA